MMFIHTIHMPRGDKLYPPRGGLLAEMPRRLVRSPAQFNAVFSSFMEETMNPMGFLITIGDFGFLGWTGQMEWIFEVDLNVPCWGDIPVPV